MILRLVPPALRPASGPGVLRSALLVGALAVLPLAARAQPAPFVLDPTFGAGGRALATFPGAVAAFAHGFHRYPDGRLLIAGYTTYPDFTYRAALARFTADGLPDPTFGPAGDGTVTHATTARLQCYDVELDAAGRILCAGLTEARAALARFTADGFPDPTFGAGGVLTVEPGPGQFHGVHRRPDGRLLLFGTAVGSHFYVWRLLPDGAPDPAFNGGTPRHVSTDFCFVDLDGITAVTPAGGLAVGCWRLAEGVVGAARFGDDGAPDPAFGGDGFVATPVPADNEPQAAAVDGAGRLLIAARPPGGASAGRLLRLLPDGTLDPAFGTGGVASFSFSASVGTHNTQHITVRPDGRLLLSGESNAGPAFLAQFTADGQPDPTLVPGGVQALPELGVVGSGGGGRELLAANYDEAGRVVGGGTLHDGARSTLGVVRLVRDGTVATEPGPGAAPALAVAPNPAVGVARLTYEVPAGGAVRLAVYDVLGREVAVVFDGARSVGRHEAALDTGRLAPGAYVVRLTTGAVSEARRLVVGR